MYMNFFVQSDPRVNVLAVILIWGKSKRCSTALPEILRYSNQPHLNVCNSMEPSVTVAEANSSMVLGVLLQMKILPQASTEYHDELMRHYSNQY
jgi:hypothetical protein